MWHIIDIEELQPFVNSPGYDLMFRTPGSDLFLWMGNEYTGDHRYFSTVMGNGVVSLQMDSAAFLAYQISDSAGPFISSYRLYKEYVIGHMASLPVDLLYQGV